MIYMSVSLLLTNRFFYLKIMSCIVEGEFYMEYDELDKRLRSLSKSEITYKNRQSATIPLIYDTLESIHIKGQKVLLMDSPEPLQSKSNILIIKHTRFTEVPLHMHSWIEINYVYSGTCTQLISDRRITLKTGQLCLIDTGVPHSIENTGEDDIIINILVHKEYLSTSFLSRLLNKGIISDFLINAISDNQNHNHFIVFHSEDNTKIPRLMRDILCEYFDQTLYYEEIINSYMVILFTELVRVFHYDKYQEHSKTSNETTLIQILQYIEDNYDTCTLSSTAEHFNYSLSYFSTLIKKSTGKSFNTLIRNQKLTQASIMLKNSSVPIYEIAKSIGYENLTFFYKKFKEHFGVSPKEYREEEGY